nr:hypothetical protein [Tanacetum cinerariifolium]
SNDMVHNYYLEEAKKKAQLHKDKALNTKARVQQSAGLPNTANGNKPKPRNFNQQPRNWPPSMSSRVSNKIVNIAEPPRNQKTFLISKDLACPACKKCIYSANYDECILKYLSKVGLKWIPIRKPVVTRYNTNDSASPLGKKTHNPKTVICANFSSLSAGTSMAFEPISSKGSSNVQTTCCSLILADSNSLPHAHAQATKTYYKHQDSRIKKAQELKTKTFENSDVKDNSSETKLRGRLLESFQEDVKYEHVG